MSTLVTQHKHFQRVGYEDLRANLSSTSLVRTPFFRSLIRLFTFKRISEAIFKSHRIRNAKTKFLFEVVNYFLKR